MNFESNPNRDHNLEMAGEGLEREEGLPEDAILVERSETFERQGGSGPLAENLGLLSPDQYDTVIQEVFTENGISVGDVEGVTDGSMPIVWPAIVMFATTKNEHDKEKAKDDILRFFGK